MSPTILTLGCRLNIAESEAIRHAIGDAQDDLIVVNTCAVTQAATREAKSAIRKAKRERPEARIVVTGCSAQIEPETFAAMPEVDLVIGNAEKLDAKSWAVPAAWKAEPQDKIVVSDIMDLRETAAHLVDAYDGRTRAFVQVQNGCDHRCTFCVIPFGRGPSRSVPMGAVVDQIERIVAAGGKEVVLSGVDLTSYGHDLPGKPALGTLVKSILAHVPDLPRLRLSSIDAVEADDALIEAFATQPRLMPHLHVSLQAGDALILKRMKRRHTPADAIRFCEKLRDLRPDMVFGADIIAGFPTETEAMFTRSLAMIEACGLTYMHAFSYSPRPGTAAARMPQLPREVIKSRTRRLITHGRMALDHYLATQVGKPQTVLTERSGIGRTPGFAMMRLADETPAGQLLTLIPTGHDGTHLTL
jgi:threonylcarbamoyladenosine tRNA methylthiotransferase MtaB